MLLVELIYNYFRGGILHQIIHGGHWQMYVL